MVKWRNDKGVAAKRLCIRFGMKRSGAKRLGANWSWGETTCYPCEIGGSNLTSSAVLCPSARHFIPKGI